MYLMLSLMVFLITALQRQRGNPSTFG